MWVQRDHGTHSFCENYLSDSPQLNKSTPATLNGQMRHMHYINEGTGTKQMALSCESH